MCSYKLVNASFEVWGFQTRVEDYIQRCIRDVLLLGHRQAFTWIDEWIDMNIKDVRDYEKRLQAETNKKLGKQTNLSSEQDPALQSDSQDIGEISTSASKDQLRSETTLDKSA